MAATVARSELRVSASLIPAIAIDVHLTVLHHKPKNLPIGEQPGLVGELEGNGGGGRLASELGNDRVNTRVIRRSRTLARAPEVKVQSSGKSKAVVFASRASRTRGG